MLPESFTSNFVKQLELLRLRARRSFLGTRQGGHVSLRRGHGVEFSDYRKYELGDNPRHIDWGVYARSDRLYVKRFQEDSDLTVHLFLDASNSMLVPEGDRKWEVARDIALALTYIALMQHDRVIVSVPGYFRSPAYQGARAIHKAADQLAELELGRRFDFSAAFEREIAQVRFPGVVVLLSDFLVPADEWRPLLVALRGRNVDLTAVQVVGPGDLKPIQPGDELTLVDSETGRELEFSVTEEQVAEYNYRYREHGEEIVRLLNEQGVVRCVAETTQSLTTIMVDNLARTGLLN